MKRTHKITYYFFHYNIHKLKNQNQFHQMRNKYNFLKSQTNPNIYQSYILTTNFSRKKLYNKHINKLNILHKMQNN
jgi:hypothetical protein